MPFESLSQVRKFHAMEDRGELPKGTSHRWAKHTPNMKKLPEHVRKEKRAEFVVSFLAKCAASGVTTIPGLIAAANSATQKQADDAGVLSRLAGTAAGLPVASATLGLAIPAIGGYFAGGAMGKARNQLDMDDQDTMRLAALANAYRRRTQDAKTNTQVRKIVASDPSKYIPLG